MKKLTPILLCLFALNVFPGLSPTEQAKVFYAALTESDFEKAAGCFAPEALASFKEMMSALQEIPEDQADLVAQSIFGGGLSLDSLFALEPKQFFAKFFETIFSQLGSVDFSNMDIIGELPEGDMRHLVIRNKVAAAGITIEKMEVASFKKVGDDWMMILSGEYKGMAEQIRKMVQ